MRKKSLVVCSLDRTPLAELVDNTSYRARNILESYKVNEITTLSFSLPVLNPKWKYLECENLIRFNNEYYIITNPSFERSNDNKLLVNVEAKHMSHILASQLISIEEIEPTDVVSLMKLALLYNGDKSLTGWKVGKVTVDRVAKRGLEANETSPFNVLITIAEKYDGILKFNSSTMTVDLEPRNSTQYPVMDFRVSKNLKGITVTYDTSEIVTRLYGYGMADTKTGIELDFTSVSPNSLPYVDNYDFFLQKGYSLDFIKENPHLFVRSNIFRDDSIFEAQDLYDTTVEQLKRVSQPIITVKIEALDNANLPSNNIVNLNIGNCVRVVDEDIGADFLCNITSREIDHENEHLINMEITNSIQYRDLLGELFNTVSNVSSVVTSGGQIIGGNGGTSMDEVKDYLNLYYLNVEQLEAKYATIDELKANYITVEYLKAHYIDAENIAAQYATIGRLEAVEAMIKDLDVEKLQAELAEIKKLIADYAEIKELFATKAEIEELKAGNLTVTGRLFANEAEIENLEATTIKVGEFEAYKATIEKLFALYATIEHLEANYIKAKQIEAEYAKIRDLDVVSGKFETLKADLAEVEKLVANKVDIEDLNAVNATIEKLQADFIKVEQLVATKVDAEYVKTEILEATKVITSDLEAIHAVIDVLDTKYATIEMLNAKIIEVNELIANKADIEDLEAAKADIGELDALVANINSILAGNIGTGTLQTIHLTAKNVVIDDAVIKDLIASKINVGDLKAGTISTDKFVIKSDNGGMLVSGSTMQFKDKNNKVRLQVGQDAEGNFNFIVFGEDGTTAIYDENGITKNAVPDGLIVDDMINDNANIQAKKIQYVSKDGNTTLQTHLEVEQGKIEALIKDTTIDGEKLKDKYLETVATVDGMKTTISNVETKVDNTTGKVTAMESKVTKIEATTDGLKAEVSKTNDKIDNLQVGGRNLIKNSNFKNSTYDWQNVNCTWTVLDDTDYEHCLRFSSPQPGSVSNRIHTYIHATNTTYTLSFYAKADTDGIELVSCRGGRYNLNGKTYSLTSKWKRYTHTYTTDAVNQGSLTFWTNHPNKNVYLANVKLEIGNKPTDWTPAPEDIDNEIKNVKTTAEQTADKFTWLVKSGTSSTNFELTDRTATLVSNYINLKGLVTFQGLNKDTQDKINASEKLYKTTVDLSTSTYDVNTFYPVVGTPIDGYGYTRFEINVQLNSGSKPSWSTHVSGFTCNLIAKMQAAGGENIAINEGFGYIERNYYNHCDQMPAYIYQMSHSSFPVFYLRGGGKYHIFTSKKNFGWSIKATAYTSNTQTVKPETDVTQIPKLNGVVDISNKMYQLNSWVSNAIKDDVTTINGGYIKTRTIGVDHLIVDEIFATGSAVMNIINAQEINANRITSGRIKADLISLYGLKVLRKGTEEETLSIDNDGSITMRGSVESYGYKQGVSGWSIKRDGDAEFNDVTTRGSLITNSGGIASNGGSGINLQINSSFSDEFNHWTVGEGYSVDTIVQDDGINSAKFTRTGLTSDQIKYLYSIKGTIKAKEGDVFTAQAKFYTTNANAIDGTGVILGIWFYNEDGGVAARNTIKVEFSNNSWVHVKITKTAPAETESVALVVGSYRNGTFWMSKPKIEKGDTPTAWSYAPEDKIKEIVFWAGSNYANRETAPFIVYNDGSTKNTSGIFEGVTTGTVKIGNVTIQDPSAIAGNDALVTIQHGGNGIKRVQLRDTELSEFAQNIHINDNFGNAKVELTQTGQVVVDDAIISKNPTSGLTGSITHNILTLDTSTIKGQSGAITINANKTEFGDAGSHNDVNIYGDEIVKGKLRVDNELNLAGRIVCITSPNGCDWNFDTNNYFTVSFNSGLEGVVVPNIINVPSGTTITAPANPVHSLWNFAGWYQEAALTNKFDFNTKITGNITLYGKWTAKPAIAPSVTTSSYSTENVYGSWWRVIGEIRVDGQSLDGGTLTYDWDLWAYFLGLVDGSSDPYKDAQPVMKKVNVPKNTKVIGETSLRKLTGQEFSIDDWYRGSSIDISVYSPATYNGVGGYCTVTNTRNGTTATKKIWVGSTEYQNMYSKAPRLSGMLEL